nr:MAG TPA: hypothetical protein [Caudoviricetes sp.]
MPACQPLGLGSRFHIGICSAGWFQPALPTGPDLAHTLFSFSRVSGNPLLLVSANGLLAHIFTQLIVDCTHLKAYFRYQQTDRRI